MWPRLFGQVPADLKWNSCQVTLNGGSCDFAAVSGGRKPDQNSGKIVDENQAIITGITSPK